MSSSLDLLNDSTESVVAAQRPNRRMADSEDLLASADLLSLGTGTPGVDDEASQEEEELSAKEVIQRMQTAWLNERFAPCLLPQQTQLVDCLLDQIGQMERNLSAVGKTDFRIPLHKMELARVRFLVTAYLRLRVKKIERFIHTLDVDRADVLSREERAYAKDHRATREAHFHALALRHMPGDFAQLPSAKKADPKLPEPDLDAAVFVAVERDAHGVLLEDEAMKGRDEELDMVRGGQHILRYRAVADLVQDGTLRLI